MQPNIIDICVIGGGINGVGVAADAAGRGLSVTLCEKDDLASHTSSESSKLIHGGIRYLEQYEFKLVREALREREILLRNAPHLVHPLQFVLPYDNHLRPAWMIRIGLLMYDYLAKRKQLGASQKINLRTDPRGLELQEQFSMGFTYMDCRTDDARLVVTNAILAREKGAHILTRTRCVHARRINNYWEITLIDEKTNQTFNIYAKAIVNAGGPWVSHILQDVTHTAAKSQVKLVKGSHFTVPKLYPGAHAFILQHPDKRVIFTIPYQGDFTLIGTTDIVFNADPNQVEISEAEIDYLLKMLAYYFKNPPTKEDINWTYSGVRALYNDEALKPSEITREYHLELTAMDEQSPILSIFGGKLTTYRTLAEHVLEKLMPYFPHMKKSWTANAVLPGGDLRGVAFPEFVMQLKQQYAFLPANMLVRYAQSYGSLSHQILQNIQHVSDLGQHFGAHLYSKEVDYLIQNEWAKTTEDIIWRRSKLGLFLQPEEIINLNTYLSYSAK